MATPGLRRRMEELLNQGGQSRKFTPMIYGSPGTSFQQDRPGFFERLGSRAAEEFTLGFRQSDLPEAQTFGEKAAEFTGAALGNIPLVAASFATGGATLAPAAGRLISRQLLRFLPRMGTTMAQRAGRVLGQEVVGSGIFGSVRAGADIARGEPVGESLMRIPSEMAFGALLGGAGLAAGAGLRALRGGRTTQAAKAAQEAVSAREAQAADMVKRVIEGVERDARIASRTTRAEQLAKRVVEETQPASPTVPEPQGPVGLLEAGPEGGYHTPEVLERYLEDTRSFYRERPDLLQQAIQRDQEAAAREFEQMGRAILPEVEQRVQQLIEESRQRLRVFPGEASTRQLAESTDLARRQDLQRADYVEALQTLRDLENPATRDRVTYPIFQEVAKERGYDFDEIIARLYNPTPAEALEDLIERERYAIISGVKRMPRSHLEQTRVTGEAAAPVQAEFPAQETIRPEIPPTSTTPETPPPPRAEPGTPAPDDFPTPPAGKGQPLEPEQAHAVGQQAVASPVNTRVARDIELMGELNPMNPTQTVKNQSKLQWAVDRTLNAAETVLRRMGPSGQRLAGMFRVAEREINQMVGNYKNQLGKRIEALSPQDQEHIKDIIDKGVRPRTPQLAQIAEDLRVFYNNRGTELVESGVPGYEFIEDATGEVKRQARSLQLQPNYRHVAYDWSRIDDIKAPEGFKKEVLEEIVESGQARTIEQAANLLRQMKKGITDVYNPAASFQYRRQIRLPRRYELSLADQTALYAQSSARQLSYHRVFDISPLQDRNGLKNVLEAIGEETGNPDNVKYARLLAERFIGVDEKDVLASFMSNSIRNMNVIRMLLLAGIPNATQSLITATRTNMKVTLEALSKVIEDRRMAEEWLTKAGFLTDLQSLARVFADAESTGLFSDWAEKSLKYSGFALTERFNQLVAGLAGKFWGEDLFRAIQQGGTGPQWLRGITGRGTGNARKVLAEAGIDVDAALRRGALDESDLLKMTEYVVKNTQYPRSVLDTPLWTQSPYGKMVFQFQRFMYQQTRTLKRVFWDDIKRYAQTAGKEGALAPAFVFPVLGGIMGLPVAYIRDSISGRERPEGIWNTYLDALSWVGAYGMFENLTQLLRGDPEGQATAFFLGPSATIAEAAGGTGAGILRALQGGEDQPGRGLRQAGRSLVRGVLPTPIGYPLARGQLPFGVDVPVAQQIFQPERFDPTGRKEATRTYEQELSKIEKAYVQWQATGNREPFAKAVRDASLAGLRLSPADINRRVSSPRVQLQILKEQLKKSKGQERQRIQARIRAIEQQMEQERLRSVPVAAQGLLR